VEIYPDEKSLFGGITRIYWGKSLDLKLKMALQTYRLIALWSICMALCLFYSGSIDADINPKTTAHANDSFSRNPTLSFTIDPTTRLATFFDTEKRITLGPYLQYLIDNGENWALSDVTGPEFVAQFRDASSDVLNFGITEKPHWFRIKLRYDGTQKEITRDFAIEFPQLAEIDFYSLNKSGHHRLVQGGSMRPNESPNIKSRHFIATLHFTPGETQWIYFNVVSRGPLVIPAYLWEPDFRFQQQRLQLIFYGAYYGIIIAMFVYNLFLFIWMRSTSYLFYIIYIASAGLAISISDGILRAYFVDSIAWANTRLMYFIGCIGIISLVQFCRLMLRTAERHSFVDKMLLTTISVGILTNLLTIVHFSSINVFLTMFLLIAVAVSMFTAGAISVSSGYREGKFFCFAWSIFCVLLVIIALLYVGVVPFNIFTSNVPYIGTAMEAVLLSFFLADRINTITMEKLASEQVAKKELEGSLANLNHSHRIKSEFFATVSHELRTPMNGVVGMLDLLSNTRLDKGQAAQVGAAIKFAHLMMYFVDNLLGFARRTDSNRLIHKPFQLRESLDNLRLQFLVRCHSAGLSFNYTIADNVPNLLVGDSSRLQGVLNHLLDNAVKYTDLGSVKFNVNCQFHQENKKRISLEFFIMDTGRGIPGDKLKDVFNPFVEAKKAEERSNSFHDKLGIGLSLCKKSADVMEADITIKSKMGDGTEIRFIVPLEIDDNREH